MMRVRKALAGAMLCAVVAVPAGAQQLFELQKVADGVHTALAMPRSPINCNAAVVVLDDAVLIAAVRGARDRGETLDQAKGSVAAALKPTYDAGMSGQFAGSVAATIETVYRDLDAKKY